VVERLGTGDDGRARSITPAGIEAAIDLGGVVDVDLEKERLARKIAQAEVDIARASAKLADDAFVNKAPETIVEKERLKLQGAQVSKEKLEQQLQALGT
jgi:valyl-tRNA synthetase